jgi:hypothetical protein
MGSNSHNLHLTRSRAISVSQVRFCQTFAAILTPEFVPGESEIADEVIKESRNELREARDFLEDVRLAFPQVCLIRHFKISCNDLLYLTETRFFEFMVDIVGKTSSVQRLVSSTDLLKVKRLYVIRSNCTCALDHLTSSRQM